VSVYEKMTKTVRSRLTYEYIQLHRFKLVVKLEGREVSLNIRKYFNTLRTGSFKSFKRPFPGFLTILTL
jgi:hypothetical protein